MRAYLFQVIDLKAESVMGPPMPEKAAAAAIRTFYSVLDNKDTLPGQHPDDFELICVGSQDLCSGVIEPNNPPVTVATGAGWLEAKRLRGGQSLELAASSVLHSL